ncbi:MAG: endonuclease/exonuclease/phosphatase family protein [Patescibacteria group bacterium]|nr:endonuclease/exonuclease/phosphatase family protein [Patescibacteria group bacterium]MDE2015190.1 endonuclease/exonuclease/phosphatase family protein [Patescibacteria group bacterium]MDE2226618.1 endonuclease/exonuclease/phosphatase family protein [Patescibacteria group bacterium]
MKLISLNIWGGKIYEPLMKFIKEQSADTDIFCFQEIAESPSIQPDGEEIRIDILTELKTMLKEFDYHFAPEVSRLSEHNVSLGQAIFIRNKILHMHSSGSVFVNLRKIELPDTTQLAEGQPSNFQYIRIEPKGIPENQLLIVNIHGLPYPPGNKSDTPERLIQSQKIINFLAREEGQKILCGDFNLLPDTESIAMIERTGMKNLIKTFGIERTRSKISPFYGKPEFQAFADYTFVSPDVNVLNFSVPDIDVSDHLPMVLEFS